MSDTFAERTLRVLDAAEAQARALGHAQVGTEHLLMALASDQDGVAGQVLHELGVGPELRDQIDSGAAAIPADVRMEFSARFTHVLRAAQEEAAEQDHDVVLPEHLLLALVHGGEGTGADLLRDEGLDLGVIAQEIVDNIEDAVELERLLAAEREAKRRAAARAEAANEGRRRKAAARRAEQDRAARRAEAIERASRAMPLERPADFVAWLAAIERAKDAALDAGDLGLARSLREQQRTLGDTFDRLAAEIRSARAAELAAIAEDDLVGAAEHRNADEAATARLVALTRPGPLATAPPPVSAGPAPTPSTDPAESRPADPDASPPESLVPSSSADPAAPLMTVGPGARVFVCYRRRDSEGIAGRLFDALTLQLGVGSVFMDVDSFDYGRDFVDAMLTAVAGCHIVLVVIGPSWTEPGHDGQRRLDQPDDYVRQEVELALRLGKRVVPVLVGGARMPGAEDLPPSLIPLTRRHGLVLSHAGFHDGLRRLTGALGL